MLRYLAVKGISERDHLNGLSGTEEAIKVLLGKGYVGVDGSRVWLTVLGKEVIG